MIATIALFTILQAPTNIPTDAEVIYPLMPRLAPIANADGSKVTMIQSIHSATVTVTKSEASYESLSLYKNTASVEGRVELSVAFESWRSGFGSAIKVEAVWSDQTVEPVGGVKVVHAVPEKGQLGSYVLKFDLPVKKLGTHSLRLKFKLPIGVSGIDREERLVAYRVADINQTESLTQFRMAIKYNQSIVFVPIDSKPGWGWQVGSEGAYLKLDGRPSNRDAVLTYRYYPGGF